MFHKMCIRDSTSLEDGPHSMEYFAEDHVGNKSQTYKFDFYYDKLAPLTASDIIGDKYLYLDKVYFSGRTKMKLTAIDNKIGVKEIKYSIDNGNFLTYEEPFYLPSVQGNHTIKFYSVDRLSNQPSGAEEYKHNINLVYLDPVSYTHLDVYKRQLCGPSSRLVRSSLFPAYLENG